MSVSPNYEARLSANHTPVTFQLSAKNDDEVDDPERLIYLNNKKRLSIQIPDAKINELVNNTSAKSLSSIGSNLSKTNDLENDLDESLDDENSDLYYNKFKKLHRPSLNPKKNFILLNTLDEESSKETRKENKINQGPQSKRRKVSSVSDHESISTISEDIDQDMLEQVVGEDTKLTFKNCLLKTMNEILRTNLQLSRKVDKIRENNYNINKRLRYLEQVLKSRGLKDQEIEEEIDRLSDLTDENSSNSKQSTDELKSEIKLEKVVNDPKPTSPTPKKDTCKNVAIQNQQILNTARRICETNQNAKQQQHQQQQEFVRQSHVNYRPSQYMHNQPHYGFNYHQDPYQQYPYRYGHHASALSVGVPNPNGVPAAAFRPAQTTTYVSPSSNAQNPKTAAALAAAVAAAMAASTQQDYGQENGDENEYDDSIEDDNSPYSQNPNEINGSITGQFSSIVPQHASIRHIPSSIVDQLELSEDVERLVSRDVIKRCIRKAKHRGNFAANLAAELFTKEERITCNCTGTRGKRQLSPRRLQVVKEITFRMYNSQAVQAATLTGGQQTAAALLQDFEEAWRKECITAIDAKNRSIGRDLIKNTSAPTFQSSQQSISPSISSTTNNSNSTPVVNEIY